MRAFGVLATVLAVGVAAGFAVGRTTGSDAPKTVTVKKASAPVTPVTPATGTGCDPKAFLAIVRLAKANGEVVPPSVEKDLRALEKSEPGDRILCASDVDTVPAP